MLALRLTLCLWFLSFSIATLVFVFIARDRRGVVMYAVGGVLCLLGALFFLLDTRRASRRRIIVDCARRTITLQNFWVWRSFWQLPLVKREYVCGFSDILNAYTEYSRAGNWLTIVTRHGRFKIAPSMSNLDQIHEAIGKHSKRPDPSAGCRDQFILTMIGLILFVASVIVIIAKGWFRR